MARKLKLSVFVGAEVYEAGSEPPADVAKQITNADAWEDGDVPAAEASDGPEEPPRSGQGATTDAWRAYADQLGVDVPDDAGRDDIIAAVDAR